MQNKATNPLVSVIIPCYNHGRYLQQAIDSVYSQELNTEIIVVDDGSSDNTREVATQNADVVYVHQQNAGLSAARNTGIRTSKGSYLLFLDADDWLLAGALRTSVSLMEQHPEAAFVSGGHEKVFMLTGLVEREQIPVEKDHYLHLLQGNYIGMHATVLYRKNVFDTYQFDPSLRACEDYDLYLKIARDRPVLHHTNLVAAYRIHGANMSGNVPLMLHHVLLVQKRQLPHLRNDAEKQAFRQGQQVWKDYYAAQLQKILKNGTSPHPFRDAVFLTKLKPAATIKLLTNHALSMIKTIIKKTMPSAGIRLAHKLGLHSNFKPAPGHVSLGDLDRVTPFSTDFGYDRGGPVDRYYIENFLEREAAAIKGRVLEIGDNEYTLRYGGSKITQSDILHVDASNTKATYIGDLSNAPNVPSDSFDAVVLTQTLHLIYDFKGALATCYRILKPGGTLLLTVPGITPIDHGPWGGTWYWSFTDRAMVQLAKELFPGSNTEVKSYGNVLSATAFLYGMGLPEVPKEKLDHNDPFFQVVVTVRAVKSMGS